MKKLLVTILGLTLVTGAFALSGCKASNKSKYQKEREKEKEKVKDIVEDAQKELKDINDALGVLDEQKRGAHEKK